MPLAKSFIARSIFILPSCQNRHRTHHSVNFYFTVLSEPSQDSSLGQFLFYRPVGTVTGLIR